MADGEPLAREAAVVEALLALEDHLQAAQEGRGDRWCQAARRGTRTHSVPVCVPGDHPRPARGLAHREFSLYSEFEKAEAMQRNGGSGGREGWFTSPEAVRTVV